MKAAITITRLDTPEQREAAFEHMTGMTREEAFRCAWDDCMAPGEVYLGYRQEHLVCAACSSRPELKRFKVRTPRT